MSARRELVVHERARALVLVGLGLDDSRACASYVTSPTRTVTAGSARRLRTQSEPVPPPASRNSVVAVEREPDLDLVRRAR